MTRRHALGLWLVTLLGLTGAVAADAGAPAGNGKPVAEASYQLSNKKYGDLLRPENANGATGTRLVLYPAEPWKCMTWKFHAAGDGAFSLQNHFTSKTFSFNPEAKKAPWPVTQVPLSKAAAERPVWQFTALADGTYKITEAKSGKALTAIKEGDSSTARIVVEAWKDSDEQKWKLNPIDPKDLTM